jgi:hypothetical protein
MCHRANRNLDKLDRLGKAQPFPSTDGRSRKLCAIARIVIWTSLTEVLS